jgi:hypothetical protein
LPCRLDFSPIHADLVGDDRSEVTCVRGGAVEEEGAVGELEGLLHPAVALPTVLAGGGGERQQGKKTVLPTVHSSHGPPPKEEEGEGRGRHGRREKVNLGQDGRGRAGTWGADPPTGPGRGR